MKLCQDCKYYERVGIKLLGVNSEYCHHPEFRVNFTDGTKGITGTLSCEAARLYDNCGLDGELWEAK